MGLPHPSALRISLDEFVMAGIAYSIFDWPERKEKVYELV